MEREYNNGQANSITYFVGKEIEQTPAYGKTTLFVVGVQDPHDVLYHANNHPAGIEHIYFGANQSFPILEVNDYNHWNSWENMINTCLDHGFWCTLDLDAQSAEGLVESGLAERRRFIPQISVKLPYLTQLGYNATIKIDDKGFDATNPGVWCHRLHNLTDVSKFTCWDSYKSDEIIK